MRIQDVVLIIKEVHDRLEPLDIPVPVTKIKDDLSRHLAVKFDLFDCGSWAGKHILGRLQRYEIQGACHAKIIVADSLNTCWTRFVTCKELAHLYIDKHDEDFTRDPVELVRSLVDATMTIDKDISSERWATIAAIELLMPWRKRQTIIEKINDRKSNRDIALLYKVPEKVVEIWRSADYQKPLTEAWNYI